MSRREQILATAAELFARRGFHGVSVADLGAACGVSGPALYKHFPSKDAMLAEMLVSISRHLLTVGRERVGAGAGLDGLIDCHVGFALEHQALIVVQDRDWDSLLPDAREEVRALQLSYVALWVEALGERHPVWSVDEASARVHATFGLINSTPHSALLPDAEMGDLLRAMAAVALDVPRPPHPGEMPGLSGSDPGR